jgi:hypothetical protein
MHLLEGGLGIAGCARREICSLEEPPRLREDVTSRDQTYSTTLGCGCTERYEMTPSRSSPQVFLLCVRRDRRGGIHYAVRCRLPPPCPAGICL